MRINRFIAQATGLSRRAADTAIASGRVSVNGQTPSTGQDITPSDIIKLDRKLLSLPSATTTILFNKPVGYICSRDGQGGKTIYDVLPPQYHNLKPVGRLDKDSSGLLLLTNDGQLAQELTHPRYQKTKIYQVKLNKPLAPADKAKIEQGVPVEDYISKLIVNSQPTGSTNEPTAGHSLSVKMTEGHNRQIRRTFAALGYEVTKLHRTEFGPYVLDDLPSGQNRVI